MPQGKQEQYEDALGSIFDFIFTQSQKPPSKTKPLKVTGVDGTSEIVDALVAAIENPAMYVNNVTMSAFQDFVDINLAKIDLDQRGGQIRLRLKDIGKILRDPGKYVGSQFDTAEAIRKSQRMAAAGEAMRGIVAGSWAAKKGLDFETRTALAGVSRPDEFSHEMMVRADKLMESHFTGGTAPVSKTRLIARYGEKKGERLFNLYKKAESAYTKGSPQDRAKIFSGSDKIFEDQKTSISELYSFLEAENIREKARLETDRQKRLDYISAARFVENISAVGQVRKYMDDTKKAMEFHQKELRRLKKEGASQSELDIHKKRIKELQTDYNMAQRYEFASKMGTFEGHWNTAKDLFSEGNLLPNIINGNFFNGRVNQIEWLQPAKKEKLKFGTSFKDSTWKKDDDKWEVEFLVPKEGKGPGSKYLNAYAEAMTPLYYLSPVTWIKSLGTGEVFAYRAHLIKKTFEKQILEEVKGALAGFDMQAFMDGIVEGKGMDYINSLSGTINADLMKKLEKFMKQEERMTKMAYGFSAISRMKKKIGDWIEEKVGKKTREAVGARLLEMGFIKTFGKDAIESWMLKGGFRSLIRGVAIAALQAIGFSIAGPVGNAIVTALTWVATELVVKIAKPVIKVTAQVLIFYIGGCFTLILVVFGSFFLMVFGKYSHVAPDEIVQCSAYSPLGLLPPNEEPPGGSLLPFTPGNLPPGQQCLFSARPTLRCTQGPYSSCPEDPDYINQIRPSHFNSPAIDVATGGNFHAPTFCDASLGNCKVVATGQGTCGSGYPAGGYVLFTAEYQGRTYQFYILHVAIGVNPGQTLSSGQAVASIVDSESWRMCSSGLHAHVTIQVNGSYADARAVLNEDFQCNVGDCPREQCWPK